MRPPPLFSLHVWLNYKRIRTEGWSVARRAGMVWQYMLGGAAQEQTTDCVNAAALLYRQQQQPVGLCSLPLVRLTHARA
jgi:hypothetical protein